MARKIKNAEDYMREEMINLTIRIPRSNHDQLKRFADLTKREVAELAGVLFTDWITPRIEKMMKSKDASEIQPASDLGSAPDPSTKPEGNIPTTAIVISKIEPNIRPPAIPETNEAPQVPLLQSRPSTPAPGVIAPSNLRALNSVAGSAPAQTPIRPPTQPQSPLLPRPPMPPTLPTVKPENE